MSISKTFHYCLALIGIFLMGQGMAAKPSPTSATQPINITSDQVFVNQIHHIAIYTGHVIADHGTGHLTGDRLKVYFNPSTHQLERMIDSGHQATYHDIDPQSHEAVDSRADHITFIQSQHQAYLDGHAYVNRNGNIARAPHLTYNQLTGTATSRVDNPQHEKTDLTIMPQPSAVASRHTTH